MATGKATTWVATLENLLHQNVSSGPVYAYVTLATVDQDNWPRGRTVVYRGMLGQSKKMVELHKGPLDADLANLLVLSTDSRSAKMDEILNNNRGEINWYFATTRDQLRLKGYIHLIPSTQYSRYQACMDQIPERIKQLDLESERRFNWNSKMSPGLRASFTWNQPGTPRHSTEPFTGVKTLDNPQQPEYQVGLDNFVLVLFEPVSVDLVRLGTNPPFSRIQWNKSADACWTQQIVWP